MKEDLARKTGSHEPSPKGLGPSGFDPSRVALRMSRDMRLTIMAADGPYVRSPNGGVAKLLRELGLTRPHYVTPATHKPVLTPLGRAMRDHLLRDSDGHRMAETASQARGEAGPARAGGIAPHLVHTPARPKPRAG